MHPARFWNREKNAIRCELCPQNCLIQEGRKGFCRARKNFEGELISVVYGKPAAAHVDPIEKKPLYHFLPGSKTFSIGTLGCNLACSFCQNHDISCADPERVDVAEIEPEKIVQLAVASGCKSISYTYNEPTIFHEFAFDTAKLARKKGLKNIIVTNGFINPFPAAEFCKVMDAANVDLKAFNDDFYRKLARGRLLPVKASLQVYKKRLWLEVTNLLIDGVNDGLSEIDAMSKWIGETLGKDVPLHFSRSFPMHRMQDIKPTPSETLQKAAETARKHLRFVYIGNTGTARETYCPECGESVIEDGKVKEACSKGHRIPGFFG
jgi:pyruvate formate lyase activating enzyme